MTEPPLPQRSLPLSAPARPAARGKFLHAGGRKLYVRGVTYGTFRPNGDGAYPDPDVVERDFAEMVAAGINSVRTYTVPPRWLLDAAARSGLYVMVGLPWEQHVTFLDGARRRRSIEARVRDGVRACAGHPAVLCYAIGNEIPSSIVRWHGRPRVERFLERLWRAVKSEDPGSLVTYVNYPSTEYLQLPFLDLVCFNVYLESRGRLDAYLARLQNLAGDRPLLLTEIGLDSRRNGEDVQADLVSGQVRTAFAAGCAGAFVFAWTDEWHRGGYDVEDWDFGLTGRTRRPKPALAAVRGAFAEVPFPASERWPRVSVVVCTHNGERTLRDCLEGCLELDYPSFEVIVVDDGSTDASAAIASEYGFRVIRTANEGLAAAPTRGRAAATGEIIAYLDDDARPDPHWLMYLAWAFAHSLHAGIGGPNVAPPGDGTIARCVANSPGGPIHVLLSDEVAEHIPGCNMAFRRDELEAIGGFDPQFRVAGDDVDVCWRLQHRGRTLGFSPAAMVWHRRRSSVRAYWRQQRGYGRAEALLERKWPEKYNAAGHVSWGGRVYQNGHARPWRRLRVYHGTWGSGLFQTAQPPRGSALGALVQMPEWYLVLASFGAIAAIGVVWRPLLLAGPAFGIAAAAVLARAWLSTRQLRYVYGRGRLGRLKLRALTTVLHVIQPAARLWGRIGYGLTPWRRRGEAGFAFPWPRVRALWSERWQTPAERLGALEATLRDGGAIVVAGGDYDRLDLEVRGGMLGAARLRLAVEEHGWGKQLARFRLWPRFARVGVAVTAGFGGLALAAGLDGALIATASLGAVALALCLGAVKESGSAVSTFLSGLAGQAAAEADEPAGDLAGALERRVREAELAGEPRSKRPAAEEA